MIFYTYRQNGISPNVPAVYDVFLRPMRKNAKHFPQTKEYIGCDTRGFKKMWRNKTVQRAKPRLRFCVARAAEGAKRKQLCYAPVYTTTSYLTTAALFIQYYFI